MYSLFGLQFHITCYVLYPDSKPKGLEVESHDNNTGIETVLKSDVWCNSK